MIEKYVKARLRLALVEGLPGARVARHEDKFASGVPDFSITRGRRACWVEVKLDKFGRRSKTTELQRDFLRDVDGVLARYAITSTGKKSVRLYRVGAPGAVDEVLAEFDRHDHKAVAAFVHDRLVGGDDHEMVRDFHRKLRLGVRSSPTADWDAVASRVEHIQSEVDELKRAYGQVDLVEVADALFDITYLCHGAALNLGLPWREGFAEVHRSNMLKERDGRGGAGMGVFKPEGWRPPDVAGVLRRAGWERRS